LEHIPATGCDTAPPQQEFEKMSRIFATAVCALTLLGPAAFAQSSMSNSSMGNSMSNGTPGAMSSSTNTMKPATSTMSNDAMKAQSSMSKPNTDTGMSNTMAPSGAMSPGNAMKPASNGMSQ
jgi:hypothetical protein